VVLRAVPWDECDRQWTSRTGAQEEAGESQVVIEKQWWSVPAGGSARLHRRPQGHVRAREPRDADLGDGAAGESARGVFPGKPLTEQEAERRIELLVDYISSNSRSSLRARSDANAEANLAFAKRSAPVRVSSGI
jgi:hypothetical protein